MSAIRNACVLVGLGLIAATQAQGAIIAAVGPLTTGARGAGGYSLAGYGFNSPTGTVKIDEFGYWDEGSNGLADSHDVGLFHYTGDGATNVYTQIASATIPSGTGTTLDGGYRWVSFTEITLSDTRNPSPLDNLPTYVVLAQHTGGDTWYDAPPSGLFNAAIGTLEGLALTGGSDPLPGNGNTLSPSLNGSSPYIYVGGNIGYVPEPASLSLLGLGGLALLRRRRA